MYLICHAHMGVDIATISFLTHLVNPSRHSKYELSYTSTTKVSEIPNNICHAPRGKILFQILVPLAFLTLKLLGQSSTAQNQYTPLTFMNASNKQKKKKKKISWNNINKMQHFLCIQFCARTSFSQFTQTGILCQANFLLNNIYNC